MRRMFDIFEKKAMKIYTNIFIAIFIITMINFSSCEKKKVEPIKNDPPQVVNNDSNKFIGNYKKVNPSDTSVAEMWYSISEDSIFISYAMTGSPGNYIYYTLEDKAGIYGGKIKFINDSSFVARYINPSSIYDNEHYVLVSNDKDKVFTFTNYNYSGDVLTSPNSSNTNYNSSYTLVRIN